MVDSTVRRSCLSGWLKSHSPESYSSPLKLQKFLFLYESFSRVYSGSSDFSHLRGYRIGPVFSDIWTDYFYDRDELDKRVEEAYLLYGGQIDETIAAMSDIIVKGVSDRELISITVSMNIWKSGESLIRKGYPALLDPSCFDEGDIKTVEMLNDTYGRFVNANVNRASDSTSDLSGVSAPAHPVQVAYAS